jgi:hypothetical protein
MRLESLLTEARAVEIEYSNADAAYKKIKKDASKYFGLLKGKEPLYRGWFNRPQLSHVFFRKKVRQDRQSKGMDSKIFQYMNKLFDMYDIPRRDRSVIGTRNYEHAEFFGGRNKEGVYWLIPLGSFDYAWVPSYDFNGTSFLSTEWDGGRFHEMLEIQLELQDEQSIIDEFESVYLENIHVNEGFDYAYKKKYEMWFTCKEYFMIPIGDKHLGALIKND